jgi:GDPmannose 4,6-dehydratase
VKVYRESYGLYAVQGWLFNHEGPRRGHEFVTRKITNNVVRIHKAIEENREFEPLFLGNIDAQRDWSDAEDMMDAVWRMLNQEKYLEITSNKKLEQLPPFSGVTVPLIGKFTPKDYVVGSGEKHSIREFVEKSFNLVDIKGYWSGNGEDEIFRLYEDIPTAADPQHSILVKIDPKFYRPAEVEILRADPTKIKEELGWLPQTTFDKLVEKMVFNDLLQIHLKS